MQDFLHNSEESNIFVYEFLRIIQKFGVFLKKVFINILLKF